MIKSYLRNLNFLEEFINKETFTILRSIYRDVNNFLQKIS